MVARRTVTVASLLRIAGIEYPPARQTIRVVRHRHYGAEATLDNKRKVPPLLRAGSSKGAVTGYSAAAEFYFHETPRTRGTRNAGLWQVSQAFGRHPCLNSNNPENSELNRD